MGQKLVFSAPVFVVGHMPDAGRVQTFTLEKARTHKYISRERKGNRWVYTYAEPSAPHKAEGADAASDDPAKVASPALSAAGLQPKATPESPWVDVYLHHSIEHFPKDAPTLGLSLARIRDPSRVEQDEKKTQAFHADAVSQLKAAADGLAPGATLKEAHDVIVPLVNKLIRDARAANLPEMSTSLIRYFNSEFASVAKRSANGATQSLKIAAKHAQLTPEAQLDAAKLYLNGKKIDLAVGIAKDKQAGGSGDIKLSDVYVSRSERIGPGIAEAETEAGAVAVLESRIRVRDLSFSKRLTPEEREHHAKQCALGLSDLASVLGLPEVMGSFNGRLSVDVSSTGKSSTLATYNPSGMVITLRRETGAGSLAHEWGHFFDNVLGKLIGTSSRYLSNEMSGAERNGVSYSENMAQGAMEAVFASDAMKRFRRRMQSSEEYKRARPGFRAYLSSPEEMWARIFERHVAYKLKGAAQKNSYLVADHKEDSYMYPNDEEIVGISARIDKLFNVFKNSDYLHKALRMLALDAMRTASNERYVLGKAGHKYLTRERKGNRWVYTYAKPGGKKDPAAAQPAHKPIFNKLGETRSGKNIYADKSAHDPVYADYTLDDHEDARNLHTKNAPWWSYATAGSPRDLEIQQHKILAREHGYKVTDGRAHEDYSALSKDTDRRTTFAISNYIGEDHEMAGYKDMNRVLRGDTKGLSDQHIARIKDFSRLINERIKEDPIDKPITLYRAAPMPASIAVGDIFSTPSLLSTSSAEDVAHERAVVSQDDNAHIAGHMQSVITIRAPKGTKVLDVNANYSPSFESEHEHILGSNQPLRVIRKRIVGDVMDLEVEAMPTEDTALGKADAAAQNLYGQRYLAKARTSMPHSERFSDDPGFKVYGGAKKPSFTIESKRMGKAQVDRAHGVPSADQKPNALKGEKKKTT